MHSDRRWDCVCKRACGNNVASISVSVSYRLLSNCQLLVNDAKFWNAMPDNVVSASSSDFPTTPENFSVLVILLLLALYFTNQANSAVHPSGVGKWLAIHVITWITKVETIKLQTRAAYGCLVAVKVCGRRLSLLSIGCTPALSVTQKRRCSCGMRLVALY